MTTKKQNRRVEEAVKLLKTTQLTYQKITDETGVDVRRVSALGLKHRPGSPHNVNVKRGRGVIGVGDRKKAAEMMLEGGLSHQDIANISGVPLGSLNKILEYAKSEQALGLPITGRPMKKEHRVNSTFPETDVSPLETKSKNTNEVEITKLNSLTEVSQYYGGPYRLDYEFEQSDVDCSLFVNELERIKQIVLAAGPGKVSYTFGVNIKGE